MDNFDQVLELLVKRVSEGLALKLNSSDYSKKLSTYTNDAGFITKTVNDLVNYYKKEEVYTKAEANQLVQDLHSISLQTVDSLPTEGQKTNVIYLVPAKGPNSENAKDEYIWLNNKWELIGTTRIAATQVHKAIKSSLTKKDQDVIKEYFTSGAGQNTGKAAGDVFVITTVVNGVTYERNVYMLNKDGATWEALTGEVDADKVIMKENIVLAGNYTQVGNVTKSANETKTLPTAGKSYAQIMRDIFTAVLQPTQINQPSVSGFALTGAKAVEYGTKLASVDFGTAVLNPGSYQYGPATGITASAWEITRSTNVSALNVKVASAASGQDTNGGKGFIIGDGSEENVVSSLKYIAKATHNEGAVAHDNMHKPSNPVKKIEAGVKTQTTAAYTGYRSFFYGHTTDTGAINSAFVRKLTNSNKGYSAQQLVLNVPKGAARVVIACIDGVKGVTNVINNSSLNADVTAVFKKQSVSVEGAAGYTAKNYNVWVWQPAKPFEVGNTKLTVTLG